LQGRDFGQLKTVPVLSDEIAVHDYGDCQLLELIEKYLFAEFAEDTSPAFVGP
jgi:hypothetical protein